MKMTDDVKRDVKMLVLEIGVIGPQAKEYQQPLEAGRSKEQILL